MNSCSAPRNSASSLSAVARSIPARISSSLGVGCGCVCGSILAPFRLGLLRQQHRPEDRGLCELGQLLLRDDAGGSADALKPEHLRDAGLLADRADLWLEQGTDERFEET